MAPPPFRIAEIRATISSHCWVKSPWRSISYVIRDVIVIFGLAALANFFESWVAWPFYWAALGTMYWALFVLGHDCGHGSFSNNPLLNSVVGHLLHSSILVPYHGWRISHRTHHQNHGHVENDESWGSLEEGHGRGRERDKGEDHQTPLVDSSIDRNGNIWTGVAHIITGVIGSGVQLGWIAGPLAMLLFASITFVSAFSLCHCYRSV